MAKTPIYEFETETVSSYNLKVGDLVLSWGNQWRKCLSIESHAAIVEYMLEGEDESHRHSGQVNQIIKKRSVTI